MTILAGWSMPLTEQEVFKLLKIQATTLMRLDKLAKEIVAEVTDQKQFLKKMLKNMDTQAVAHEEKKELSEDKELPNNVLLFPADDVEEG